jgi:hypothetical protein
VLDRIKPKSLQELFEVMQEYCKSDKGERIEVIWPRGGGGE